VTLLHYGEELLQSSLSLLGILSRIHDNEAAIVEFEELSPANKFYKNRITQDIDFAVPSRSGHQTFEIIKQSYPRGYSIAVMKDIKDPKSSTKSEQR